MKQHSDSLSLSAPEPHPVDSRQEHDTPGASLQTSDDDRLPALDISPAPARCPGNKGIVMLATCAILAVLAGTAWNEHHHAAPSSSGKNAVASGPAMRAPVAPQLPASSRPEPASPVAAAANLPTEAPLPAHPQSGPARNARLTLQDSQTTSQQEATVPAPAAPQPTDTRQTAPNQQKPAAKAPEAQSAAVAKRITGIRVVTSDRGAMVRIAANVAPNVRQSRLTSPDRVVLDMDAVCQAKAPGVPANSLISNVRLGRHGGKTRIVIDLKKAPGRVQVVQTGSGLEVRLR